MYNFDWDNLEDVECFELDVAGSIAEEVHH